METSNPVNTPMVEKSKLDEDPQGKGVDLTRYLGMIGSLMYLTSTFANADHAGCQDTRRSTSGSMQLLGDRLTMALDSTKFLYTAITKVPLSYFVKTFNTQDPSILTSDTISSRSKWKIGWFSYTWSEQNIRWQISLPRIMSQEEIQQVAREEAWVPKAERVKITTINMRIYPTMTQKEETYQVILDIIKNTTFYKAFLSTADVLEIYM
ncbi:hypothetical protein Tco_0815509 [Tanacetum coccineum]